MHALLHSAKFILWVRSLIFSFIAFSHDFVLFVLKRKNIYTNDVSHYSNDF